MLRNRIKRRIREAYRLSKADLFQEAVKNESALIVGLVYSAREELPFRDIDKDVQWLLKKLLREIT